MFQSAWIFVFVHIFVITGSSASEDKERPPLDSVVDDLTGVCSCVWSQWMNNQDYNPLTGDNNSYSNLRLSHDFCKVPSDIECRSALNPEVDFFFLQSKQVICNVSEGLICKSQSYDPGRPVSQQSPFYCDDFELRVKCCECPKESTSSAIQTTSNVQNTDNVTATNILLADDDGVFSPNVTRPSQPTEKLEHVLPLYIIIVIILAAVIIFGIIICVVRWRSINRKTSSKHSHHYVGGHLDHYQQRPVSFTEVDNHISEPSSLSRSSLGGSYRPERFNKFDRGQLLFLQNDKREQQDSVNPSRASADSFPRFQDDVPRRWFPDEYERSLEKQGPKPTGKNWLSRAFTPAQKNTPFVDDANES